MSNTIRPGVVIDGQTYYPSGNVWLLAFARSGHIWALEELEKKYPQELRYYMHEMRHYPNVQDEFFVECDQ